MSHSLHQERLIEIMSGHGVIFHLSQLFCQHSILVSLLNKSVTKCFDCVIFPPYFIFQTSLIILKLIDLKITLVNWGILEEFRVGKEINRTLQIGNLQIQSHVNLFHPRNLNIFLFDLGIFGDNQGLILSFSLLIRFHRHCNLLCNLL